MARLQKRPETPLEAPLAKVQERLRAILEGVPFVRISGWRPSPKLQNQDIDLVVDVIAEKERWTLLVEVKGIGEPRIVRGAIQKLQSVLADFPRGYGVLAVPYMSTRAGEICSEAEIGFVDFVGNCRLVFDRVFIERKGLPKSRAEKRPLRTLFAPKASRVIRVLFGHPKRGWQVQALAREAEVSLGLAFKVKERLLDLEYAVEEEEGVRLARPEDLLKAWATVYSYQKNAVLDCYGPAEVPELERSLADFCRAKGIRYAFTLFSGAARVAPFARYTRGFAYIADAPTEVTRRLEWKRVDSGANFTILTPFDQGVFYGTKEVDGDKVASDVQLYLDLVGYKGRGEEAATFILEKRLRPRW